jgi:3-hydroxyacyl-CoA dehydrogenase
MAANAVQAKSELYMGLVEVGVGLIPGGSGNLQLLRNIYGAFGADPEFSSFAFPFLKKIFMNVGTAKVATSAEEAKEFGFLQASDGISMNGDFAIADAKARVIGMHDSGFRPPRKMSFYLPGRVGRATFETALYDMKLNNYVSEHDCLIGRKVAEVITGGDASPTVPVTEDRILELEQEAFLSLCGEQKTLDRIGYMLQNNKPLRN